MVWAGRDIKAHLVPTPDTIRDSWMSNRGSVVRRGVPTVPASDNPEVPHFGVRRSRPSSQRGAGWDSCSPVLQTNQPPALREVKVGLQRCRRQAKVIVGETFQPHHRVSTEPDDFTHQTPACSLRLLHCLRWTSPPQPPDPSQSAGPSLPRWKAGPQQPQQRREKPPLSGSSSGKKTASFLPRVRKDYAKPLNVGLHALFSGARPPTAPFRAGWRAQCACLPP